MRDKVVLLFIGDVVGHPGRRALQKFLPRLAEKHRPSVVIANGENAAGGSGLTEEVGRELFLQVPRDVKEGAIGLGLTPRSSFSHFRQAMRANTNDQMPIHISRPITFMFDLSTPLALIQYRVAFLRTLRLP